MSIKRRLLFTASVIIVAIAASKLVMNNINKSPESFGAIDIDNYPGTEQQREMLFASPPPSINEINAYLMNKTFIVNTQDGSDVWYFGSDRRLWHWGFYELQSGEWTLRPGIIKKILHGQIRTYDIQSFCLRFDVDDELRDDRCRIISRFDRIFGGIDPKISIVDGDPLDLSTRKTVPIIPPSHLLDLSYLRNLLSNNPSESK